jgi:hypothetical protein
MARIIDVERLAHEIAEKVESETGVHVNVAFHERHVELSTSLRVAEDEEEFFRANERRMEAVETAAEELARATGGQFDANTDCEIEEEFGGGEVRAEYRCLVYVPPGG